MPGSEPKLSLQAFDVVVVPFPFTDRTAGKRRPAIVLSTQSFNLSRQSRNQTGNTMFVELMAG